jgi:hypothetical protein
MSGDADGIGTIFTGGIAAHAVEHVANPGDSGHSHAGAGGACLNCGAIRAGEFCQSCGQSGHTHRHVMAIGHDIAHGVFHFEGKFWSTLPLLILRPGELTRRYVHGERAKFVSPMALFLFSVFLLFAAVNRVSMPDAAGTGQVLAKAQDQIGDQIEKAKDKLDDLKEKRGDLLGDDPKANTAAIDQQIADMQKEVGALTVAATRIPTTVRSAKQVGHIAAGDNQYNFDVATGIKNMPAIDTGSGGLNRQIAHVKDNPALYAYKLKMASYKYSWALIPISVPFIWMMFFWRRDVGLYDHAIFAIYSLSFMTLLCVALIGLYLIGAPAAPLWLAIMILPPIHMYRQLKAGYVLSRFGALWRTAFLLLATSIAGALFFAFLVWLEAE